MKKLLLILLSLSLFTFFSCETQEEQGEELEPVTSFSFEKEYIRIGKGVSTALKVNIEPASRINSVTVSYSLSNDEQVISLTEKTNSGVIVNALKGGSSVIIAKCEGFTSYLEVDVFSDILSENPFISFTDPVYELTKGDKKTFQVSLSGGEVSDNALFEWKSLDENVCHIDTADNACILTAKEKGFTYIEIKHPKAKYPAKIMVYVNEPGENPVYITTKKPVFVIGNKSGTQHFYVNLANSKVNNLSLFTYEIIEGKDVIDINANNNAVSVTPKKCGTAVIKVSHEESREPLKVRCYVANEGCPLYIDSDECFLEMTRGDSSRIHLSVEGEDGSTVKNNEYKIEITDKSVIDVSCVQDFLYVKAKKSGSSFIKISSSVTEKVHEIYVCVNEKENELYYISAPETLIKCEVGDDNTFMSLSLAGGNESDINGFQWKVSDKSIIELESSYGNVSYSRSATKVYDGPDFLDANALIVPKNPGRAEVTVMHPKSETECKVTVLVYPEGTLKDSVAKVKGPSVIKVLKGNTYTVNLEVISGNADTLKWEIEKDSIASISPNGSECTFNGISSGNTTVKCISGNETVYCAPVFCGTQEELDSLSYIYADQSVLSVKRGEDCYIKIKGSSVNVEDGEVSVSDNTICSASMAGDILIVKGLKVGSSTVAVNCTGSSNVLVLIVNVYDEIDILKPYYFTYESFFGVVIGEREEYKLSISSSDQKDKADIKWTCEDENICSIDPNGESCIVQGVSKGRTVLYAHSDKCEKDARIVVYTAETQAELESMIILECDKRNYLCKTGDEIFASVSVSERLKNYSDIIWESDDISVVKVEANYENAVLKCMSEGDCIVTVRCKTASPIYIYISVRDEINDSVPMISVNPYIEIDEQESVTVKVNTSGLSESEINNLKWEIKDETVGLIKANSDSCIIKGLKPGYTDIIVSYSEKNIQARICLIVYEKDVPHLPVLVCDKSLYEVEKGGYININISFGSVKPSESVMSNIKFDTDSDIIKINSNINICTVEAVEEGSCIIKVSGEGFYNSIDIKINVTGKENQFWEFDGLSIVKILTGKSFDYECKLKNKSNGQTINCNSNINFELEDNDGTFSILQAQNVLHITANKSGKTYLKISHPQACDTIKVLLFAADTQEELENVFLMNAVKDYYLLRNGEEEYLELEVECEDQTRIKQLKWSLNNSNICSFTALSKTKMRIRAKKEGEAVFTVTHPDYDGSIKFYISITENVYSSRVSIVTPSILIIPVNKIIPEAVENEIPEHDLSYSSQIISSLSESEAANFVWKSLDESIVKVSGNGKYFTLSGIKKGCTEIEVKYDSINYRRIVCRVIDENESENDISLINIDERYHVCPKGTSFSLNPYMAKNISDQRKNTYSILQDNGVIKIENRNGSLFVNCVEEGVSSVRVSNSECENTFDLYFEVRNIGNISAENEEKGSLTSLQSLYTLDVNEKTNGCVLNVTGVNIKQELMQFISWSCADESIVSIVPSGDYCTVYPKKVGVCDIKASSVYSYNDAVFRVVVCDRDEIKIPYIKTNKNTMRLKSGESGEFNFEIKNLENYDVSKFTYSIKDDKVCSVINEGSIAQIKGLTSGQTVLTVGYEGLESINCVISVQGVIDNLVYLQSDDVYSVVQQGYSKKISVELIGYEEINQNNFKWTFKNEEDKSKLTLSPSGSSVVVRGIEEGFVTLICTHTNSDPLKTALCPLEVSVFIVNENDVPVVYMKTDGIIQMKEGEKQTATVELVGGHESELGYFEWNVNPDSRNIIKIAPSQNQALITGLSSGVGRISVTHPSCIGLNTIEIVVVVNEDETKDSLQITTDSTIIEGKLSDSYKTVNVRLAGGSVEQQLLFTWEIVSYESVEKNNDGTSLPVVSLVGQSGEQNIVKYLREGNAIVRVKNSATSHYLDIKFIINEYSALRFDNTNVTLKEYESATVTLTSPSSKTVVFNSSDENIATVYGTSKVCCIEGLKAGYAVITARTTDGLLSDQITVRVNKNTDSVPLYLTCTTSLVSMDTTDTNGCTLKGTLLGTLNGEAVNVSQSDFIKWKIKSGKTNIIKIVGSNSKEAVGKEIAILPVTAGEETIVLSHPQTERTKEVYVKVSSAAFSLAIDDNYGVFEVGDIGSVSCTLSGVPSSEEKNIVWHTSDSSVVVFNTENGEGDTVYGTQVVFRCKDLCEEGLPITVTYKDMIKTYTVFIKALPSLHLMTNNDLIRSGQTSYYNIICTPEEYIGDLSYTYSSSAYIITTQNGVMMTGLIRNEKERLQEGDNPPQGIRPPYFKVTGGARQGMTSFNFECRNLTSVLNINTDNSVMFEITSYDEFDKNNRLVQHKDNPTVVEVRADSKYTRVYYKLEPEVNVDQLFPQRITPSLVNSFRIGNVTMVNGKNTGTTGRFFDLYPDEKGCNWGDVKLTVSENGKVQTVGFIRVSFSMPDSDRKFNFSCQNGVPARFVYDTANGIVRGCGKGDNQLEGQKAQMNLIYSAPYCYANYNSTTEIYVEVGNKNLFESSENFYNSKIIPVNNNSNQSVYKIVRKTNPVLVTFEWPSGYGLTGKYSKYFVFYEEYYK